MTFVLLTLLACFPEISKYEEERFPENPNHDYDEDNISDAEDCDDANKDIGRPITYYLDEDGDGFGVESTAQLFCPADKPDGYVEAKERNGLVVFDCDDTPADEDSENGRAIHPDAEEICDFINNDCDEYIDEDVSDAPLWFFDADEDGYGNFFQPEPGCPDEDGNGPTGYVGNYADCDDTNGTVFPNAEETCNEIDDNCNGIVDESLSSDAQIWYADSDGDGFGARNNAQPSCVQPEGFVLDNTDCNDLDATISPIAIESCEGAGEVQIDNDCDGLINEGADSTAPQNSSTFYADVDGDGYGDPNATLIQCDIITGYVTNSEDCNDGDATLNPATVWYQDSDSDGEGSIVNTLVQCIQPTQYVRNATDCNDADSSINTQDGDSDGYSTCDGDCDDTDANANLSDADGDGQDSCSGDCNDNDPSIYLNAPETCNSIDDDCDGNIDEEDAIDRTAWYADSDGDGEGDGGSVEFACDQPVGFVANLDDCLDTDAAINTSATEICDTVDNNCDGLIDDADANVDLNTATEFFEDADFDGYGNPLQSTFSCLQPPGFVPNSDDCDDSNLLRNPNGFEYCNNIDDNCDGTVDELAVDSTDYFVDADGDGHGALVDTATGFDLNSCPTFDPITNLPIFPTRYSSTNDDCDDGDAAISPSASELCSNGIDENCDGHNTAGATDVSTFLVDADGDTFGSGERDSNGDLAYALDLCVQPYGYVPYSVNDPLDCDDGDFETKPGAVELCNGKRDNCPIDGDNSVPSDEWDDDGDGYVECTIDSSFLFNSDGTVNLWNNNQVVFGGGDCEDTDSYAYPNAIEICNGVFENCEHPLFDTANAPMDEVDDDLDGYVECEDFDSLTWEGASSVIGGEDCNDGSDLTYPGGAPFTDATACLTDYDGDGYADRSWDLCPVNQSLTDARFETNAGVKSYGLGDVDGDGLDDILVDNSLFLGSTIVNQQTLDPTLADYTFIHEGDYSVQMSATRVGDVDGDGLDDILISNYNYGTNNMDYGRAYLIFGTSLGNTQSFPLSDADYTFTGLGHAGSGGTAANFGGTMSSAGDVDGDGKSDILIAAAGCVDGNSNSYNGITYLYLSSNLGVNTNLSAEDADYTFLGENITSEDCSGFTLSSLDDIDADGLDDFLIGTGNASKVYLILGSSLGTTDELSLSQADFAFQGNGMAQSITEVGDIDGDGVWDFVVGDYYSNAYAYYNFGYVYSGQIHVFLGGNIVSNNDLIPDFTLTGINNTQCVGYHVEKAGDLDGDGLMELAYTGCYKNKVHIVTGISLTSDLYLAQGDFIFQASYNSTDSFFAAGGDIDGDGLDDLLIEGSIFSACEN